MGPLSQICMYTYLDFCAVLFTIIHLYAGFCNLFFLNFSKNYACVVAVKFKTVWRIKFHCINLNGTLIISFQSIYIVYLIKMYVDHPHFEKKIRIFVLDLELERSKFVKNRTLVIISEFLSILVLLDYICTYFPH